MPAWLKLIHGTVHMMFTASLVGYACVCVCVCVTHRVVMPVVLHVSCCIFKSSELVLVQKINACQFKLGDIT